MDHRINELPSLNSEVVEASWHQASAPRTLSPNVVSREELLLKLRSNRDTGGNRRFVLVELRRNDHEVRYRSANRNILAR